jgi:hypothetical protein
MCKTRQGRCRESIKKFFENNDNLGLELNFNLEKVDEKGWKTGRYIVSVPNKWTRNIPKYSAEQGKIILEEQSIIQDIPTIEQGNEIAQNFKTVFEPFEHKIESISRIPIITSYVRIYQNEIEHDVDTGIETYVFRIRVMFYKQEIPFPEFQPTNIEDINKKLVINNRRLQEQLNIFHREVGTRDYNIHRRMMSLHRQLTEAHDDLNYYQSFQNSNNNKHFQSYRKIINDLYKEIKKEFECPVCYEAIKTEDAFTTPCNHVICNECSSKCSNICPMCRQDMCCI